MSLNLSRFYRPDLWSTLGPWPAFCHQHMTVCVFFQIIAGTVRMPDIGPIKTPWITWLAQTNMTFSQRCLTNHLFSDDVRKTGKWEDHQDCSDMNNPHNGVGNMLIAYCIYDCIWKSIDFLHLYHISRRSVPLVGPLHIMSPAEFAFLWSNINKTIFMSSPALLKTCTESCI